MKRTLATFACILALSACSGGGSMPSSQSSQTPGSVALSIHIPETTTSSNKRVPKYVSPSTQGMQITDGVHGSGVTSYSASVDLSASSAACTAVTGGRTCTASITAPATSDDFTFTSYDATPSGANFGQVAHELGTATLTATITGGASNTVNVALGGLPKALALLVPYSTFYGSGPLAFNLGIEALDADGNIILAGFNTATNGANSETDTYASPITVALNEMNPHGGGDTRLSLNGGAAATSVIVTKTTDVVTASYDGLAPLNYALTFAATAASVAPSPPAVPSVPMFMTGAGPGTFVNGVAPMLSFTGSSQTETFTVYEQNYTGTFNANLLTFATTNCPYTAINLNTGSLAGTGTTFTVQSTGIQTVGAGCEINVSDGITASANLFVTRSASLASLYVVNFGNSTVTSYSAGASGNVTSAPLTTLTGLSSPVGMAVDGSGNIYVANETANTVTVYPPGANGPVTPTATIGGGNTGLSSPYGVAVDSSGRIYVANYGGGNIAVFAANPSGNVTSTPIASISTAINGPEGVAVDASGKVYVANNGESASVTVYSAYPTLGLVSSIGGGSTGLSAPDGVALDSSGNIYVSNGSPAANVLVFPANPPSIYSGSPIATIGGGSTGISLPAAVGLDANGLIYVANDYPSSNVLVFAANPTGNVTTAPIATYGGGSTTISFPRGVAVH